MLHQCDYCHNHSANVSFYHLVQHKRRDTIVLCELHKDTLASCMECDTRHTHMFFVSRHMLDKLNCKTDGVYLGWRCSDHFIHHTELFIEQLGGHERHA